MSPTVAVIDDDESVRSVMAEVLEDDGYSVLQLADVAGAVEALAATPPDALVIDLRLGVAADGLAVLAQLEHEATLRSVPVLVCSADTLGLQDAAPKLLARGYGVLAKPFNIDELLHWVSERVGSPA